MKTARVVIEFIFEKKRVPKKVLEAMVMHFADMKDELIAPFTKYDENLSGRVFYDDFAGTPQVSVLDAMSRPKFLRYLRLGRKKVKPNVRIQKKA